MLTNVKNLATHAKEHLSVLAGTAVLCCSFISSAQALPSEKIGQIVFFGDSLSDSGFNDEFPGTLPLPHLPPGKRPTFTTYNGYTWSQYVAHDLKGIELPRKIPPFVPDMMTNNTTPLIPGSWPVSGTLDFFNYAAGGSTTDGLGNSLVWAPSLKTQVDWYISQQPNEHIDDDTLIFIWEGANDILTLLNNPVPPTELQLLTASKKAAVNIGEDIEKLSKHGARKFVVLSLPNIGITPLVQGAGVPGLPEAMKNVSFTFNSMLNQELGKVIAKRGVKVLYVDTYDLLDQVIIKTNAGLPYVIDGQEFTFVNYTTPACAGVPTALYCYPFTPEGYVFADTLHPTDEAHQVIAKYVEQQLATW